MSQQIHIGTIEHGGGNVEKLVRRWLTGHISDQDELEHFIEFLVATAEKRPIDVYLGSTVLDTPNAPNYERFGNVWAKKTGPDSIFIHPIDDQQLELEAHHNVKWTTFEFGTEALKFCVLIVDGVAYWTAEAAAEATELDKATLKAAFVGNLGTAVKSKLVQVPTFNLQTMSFDGALILEIEGESIEVPTHQIAGRFVTALRTIRYELADAR